MRHRAVQVVLDALAALPPEERWPAIERAAAAQAGAIRRWRLGHLEASAVARRGEQPVHLAGVITRAQADARLAEERSAREGQTAAGRAAAAAEQLSHLRARHAARNQTTPEKEQPMSTSTARRIQPAAGGFRSFSHFARDVVRAERDKFITPELARIQAALSITGSEGSGADGGYPVPPVWVEQLTQRVLGERSIFGSLRKVFISTNAVAVPFDPKAPWETSSVTVSREPESAALLQSKAALAAAGVRAVKLQALVPVTDELLEDAPGLEAGLLAMVSARMEYRLHDELINGDGVGKLLGLLATGGLVTQTAEGGQTAATFNLANATKMAARLPASARATALWIVHPDAMQQIESLGWPAYAPRGVSGRDQATLLGMPVFASEASPALGQVGDVILADGMSFIVAIRAADEASAIAEVPSIHMWFDQGITALRFTMRVGGRSLWGATIQRAKSSTTLSGVVALAAR